MKTRRTAAAYHSAGENGLEDRDSGQGSRKQRARRISKAAGDRTSRMAHRNGQAELDKVELLKALLAFREGDFSIRLAPNLSGLDGKIADAFNDVLEINQKMARELERINHVVGAEGRLSQRAGVGDVTGSWKESVENVNNLITNLVHPTSETARV